MGCISGALKCGCLSYRTGKFLKRKGLDHESDYFILLGPHPHTSSTARLAAVMAPAR